MPDRSVGLFAFRRFLFWAVVAPILLMSGLAVILVFQVNRLTSNARWVEHTESVISHVNRLEKLTIDLETGMRGYLVVKDDLFLQPYNESKAIIDGLFDSAIELVSDHKEQATALRELRGLKDQWMEYAVEQIERRRTGQGDWQGVAATGVGKKMMDNIRARYSAILATEEALRSERTSTVERSTKITVWTACGATVFFGILMAALSRGQIHWLSTTYEQALTQSRDLSNALEQRVEERTKELSQANGQLGEANKELEAFAYSISHDLRAPMRHITGFSDLMRRSIGKTLPAEELENLDIIYNTAVLAGRMVDDLLAFSRVGRTHLRLIDVDVNVIVRQCIAELEPETRDRQIEWKVNELRNTRGDTALLKMVFQNLLSNAVKYTQKRELAEIEIDSRAEREGTTFIIRDNGVGFDMAYVHKLFGVFQRLHRSEDFEGTGIGLANVRRIIVRHGGEVRAEGVPDKGATFFVYLPN